MIADASNEFAGQWVYVATAVIGALGIILGIGAYFATSREVQKLSEDMADINKMLQRQNEVGEERAKELHERVNPLEGTVGRLEGRTEAFEMAFEKFTRIIQSTSTQNNETITAFTRSLDTFARILSDRNHHN